MMMMMTKRVANSYSQKGREGRWWSTWRLWLGGSWVAISTKDARFEPPRWWWWWPRGLLIVIAKRVEKEDDDQHENCDQKGCKQLQEMQDLDHQDQDHDDQEGH
jgi:hypothetical protein